MSTVLFDTKDVAIPMAAKTVRIDVPSRDMTSKHVSARIDRPRTLPSDFTLSLNIHLHSMFTSLA